MDEVLAFGGDRGDFQADCTAHLEDCENCQAFLEESLALNQLMEEPIPFPPVNLTEQVMERVLHSEREEPSLPWAERLAWAASGAVGMYLLDRIPEYSSDWFSGLETLILQAEWAFSVPLAMSASTLFFTALILLIGQGALVYKTRGSA